MSEKVDFEVDQLLLYQVEHDVVNDHHYYQTQIFNSTTTDLESPKMLCIGDSLQWSSDSSFPSSTKPISSPSSKSTNQKKRNVVVECAKENTVANHRSSKKPKTDRPSAGKKREKLGERISALQQLVSPFGKTDTASVLHEALGYIRFLHNQVLVLCSPYLEGGDMTERKGSTIANLRSQGLCLVPMDYMAHVAANNNGADYWSSIATMATNNHQSVSSTGSILNY